jgi:hypothetical protein
MGLKRTASAQPLPLSTSLFTNRGFTHQVPSLSTHHPRTTTDLSHKHLNMQTHSSPVEELMAKLHAQQQKLARQTRDLEEGENLSSVSSTTDPYAAATPPVESANLDGGPEREVLRLRQELEVAQERMAQMDLQLTQSRLAQHTMEEAIGSPFPSAQHLAASIPGHTMVPSLSSLSQALGYTRAVTPYERGPFSMPHQ